MRYFLLTLSLYLASTTWNIDLAMANDQEKSTGFASRSNAGKSSDDSTYNNEALSDRSTSNDIMNNDDTQYVSKRVPSGFFGMRGKKPFDGWISPRYDEYIYKRAPTGFFGLRGKKDNGLDYGVDYEKRVPSGFFGLRGKKYYDYMTLDDGDDDSTSYEKRVPYGFMGLRGKREYDEELDEMKRAAPENRFFGMRGKKMPSRTGFFGMRGKKYPYEFRGKFVGVRGKRLNELGSLEFVNSEEIPRYGEDMSLNQLMLLLNEKSPAAQLHE